MLTRRAIEYPSHLKQEPDVIAWNARHPKEMLFRFDPRQKPIRAHQHVHPDGELGGWVQTGHVKIGPDCYFGKDATAQGNVVLEKATRVEGPAKLAGSMTITGSQINGEVFVSSSEKDPEKRLRIIRSHLFDRVEVWGGRLIEESRLEDFVKVGGGGFDEIEIRRSQLKNNVEVHNLDPKSPSRLEHAFLENGVRATDCELAFVTMNGKVKLLNCDLAGYNEQMRIVLKGVIAAQDVAISSSFEANGSTEFDHYINNVRSGMRAVKKQRNEIVQRDLETGLGQDKVAEVVDVYVRSLAANRPHLREVLSIVAGDSRRTDISSRQNETDVRSSAANRVHVDDVLSRIAMDTMRAEVGPKPPTQAPGR